MTIPPTSSKPDDTPAGPEACPQCGHSPLESRHCKLVCPNCGYVESCEDLFPRDPGQCPTAKPDESGPPGPAAAD